jgi:hypothetical protein
LLLLVVPVFPIGLWVAQPTLSQNRPSGRRVHRERLKEHVKVLSTEMVPRSYRYPENLARCADYIRGHLLKAGAAVSAQKYAAGRQDYVNIIGRFGPATGPCVVVGAHYDACEEFPGADDNASGIAGLIELAYLLGQQPPPAIGVELVAYCTEEPPFFDTPAMGSYQHAQSLRTNGVEVVGMLALEMIGYFNEKFGSQTYPVGVLYAIYPSAGNYIVVIGNTQQRRLIARVKGAMKGATDLPVWSASIPSRVPGVDFSDHRCYWAFGYPAVMITDTAFYRNRLYHTGGDTWERLDYERMAKVVMGAYEAVRALSSGK